jgi:hypothetical protein
MVGSSFSGLTASLRFRHGNDWVPAATPMA